MDDDRNEAPASVTPLSAHGQRLIDEGYKLLFDSIPVTRDIAKTMISISLSGIPAFIALAKLKNGGATDSSGCLPGATFESLVLLPPFLFLMSALLYLAAYLPVVFKLDPRVPATVENARQKIYKRRLFFLILASLLFFGGAVLGILIL